MQLPAVSDVAVASTSLLVLLSGVSAMPLVSTPYPILGMAVARTAFLVLKPAAARTFNLRFFPRNVFRRFSKIFVVLALPPTVPTPSIFAGPLAADTLPLCTMLLISCATLGEEPVLHDLETETSIPMASK